MSSAAHPVDILIVVAFLAFNLLVGLAYGRRATSMQDYAIGRKDFSTATLTATIVVSWIAGFYLFSLLGKVYQEGLYFAFVMVGASICLVLIGQVALRMSDFLHNVSVAEALGDLYGKQVRIIAAISGILSVIGVVAIEFQIIGKIVTLIFGIEGPWITMFAAAIVILYSLSGGIRAVTFTDVFQFLTFCIFMPVIALVVWNHLQDPQQVVHLFHTHPNFKLSEVIGWHPKLRNSLIMFAWFAIPGMDPVVFQRISMSRSVLQAKRSFNYAGIISFLAILLIIWLAILLLANDHTLDPDNLVSHIVQNYASVGLKGFIGVGVMAISMSTADSYLNASSVLFANDILKPLNIAVKYDVRAARIFCGFLGVSALLLALYANNILELLMLSNSFYMPVVTVPLLMAVWGFRTSKRGALMGIAAGFLTVILWSLFFSNGNSILPGIVANLCVLLGSHYLLREPGGWQKVAPDSPLALARATRKEARKRRIQAIKNFRLYAYLKQNLPQQEHFYSLLGFYAMVATYSALYTIEPADVKAYSTIYNGIVHAGLFVSTALLTYPIWPNTLKGQRFIAFFWPLSIGAILFLAGALIVMMSNFHLIQMMVLMINLLIAVLLLQWPLALALAVGGVSLAVLIFEQYTGMALLWSALGSVQFRMIYGLLLFASLLIALFTHKNAYRQLGRKNEVLAYTDQENQASLLRAATERQQALQALEGIGVSRLLTITKDLQSLRVAEEDEEKLHAIQTALLPMAFQVQGIAARAQDYLRLKVTSFSIQDWMARVRAELQKKDIDQFARIQLTTQHQKLEGDAERLTTLVAKSIVALQALIDEEESPSVLVMLEDTQLQYPLPDVAPGYVKHIKALRIGITTRSSLPPLAPSYEPHLSTTASIMPETPQTLEQLANGRIIKAHYGHADVSAHTLLYVIPIDVKEVRPRDMDKAYMELNAAPVRSNDYFKNDQVDAQAQEKAFLAAIAQHNQVDLGLVKVCIELIKWYHGPVKRLSKEPFYLHPLAVAQIVLDYDQDQATILGALLHDTIEDTPMLLQHIEAVFGPETARIVDVVTHLQSMPGSIYKVKLSAAENLQMLERTGNKQGLYVKLADRMHNMRTIEGHRSMAKRKMIAEETMQFFVPLAEKMQLHDAAQEFRQRCLAVLNN